MSNKKIWSIPIAIVALLMLAAVVFAAAPKKGFQIPDQTITISASNGSTTVNLGNVDGAADGNGNGAADDEAAFTDADTADTTLAYTALTADASIADVELSTDTSVSVATAWWNNLDTTTDCSIKATRLNFSLTVDSNSDGTPDNAPGATPTGLCRDYDDLSGATLHAENTSVTPNLAAVSAQDAVVYAFHWDMLNGNQMAIAAGAAGQTNTAPYKKNFGKLTHAQKLQVISWFADASQVLAKGEGSGSTLTLASDGIDATAPNDKAGSTTIYVNVSDSAGRLNPNVVGQTFTVTANRTPAPDIPTLAQSHFSAPTGTGNSVVFTDRVAGPPVVPAKLTVRVNAGTTKIMNIDLANNPDPHQELIDFSLINGDTLPFVIKKTTVDTAEVSVRSGQTITSANSPYNFTFLASESGNEASNSESVPVSVTVVDGNVAPSFASDTPTTATVAERAKDALIGTFTATDPNNQALTYSVAAKSESGTAVGQSLAINANTGELKTKKTAVRYPTDNGAYQPDYIEDDADTKNVDESMNCGTNNDASCNEHVFVITVSDGTLSAKHEFTLTITDSEEGAPDEEQTLEIAEDNAGGLVNAIGTAPDFYTGNGTYTIGQQIGDDRKIVTGDAILFAIDSSDGNVYLKKENVGKLDYESGATRYTLSVTETVGENSGSGFVIIKVTDVNEAPEFIKADGSPMVKTDKDGNEIPFELVALEGTAVGTIVKIGTDAGGAPTTDNAAFAATDKDSAATGNQIAYDLWYDSDTTDTDTAKDDLYTGASALVSVDANGNIKVNSMLDADNGVTSVALTLRAYDPTETVPAGGTAKLVATLPLTFEILDTNVAPTFDDTTASPLVLHKNIPETAGDNYLVATYNATDADDPDNDTSEGITYEFRNADDVQKFTITDVTTNGETSGELRVKAGANLDVDAAGAQTTYIVELKVCDSSEACSQIAVNITVDNVNDNAPVFNSDASSIRLVPENTARGTVIGNYSATDADGDAITYSLSGADSKSFSISNSGMLMTLEALDADGAMKPCGAGCDIKVMASDREKSDEMAVTITVTNVDDSVSGFSVSKANPIANLSSEGDDAMSALADAKTTMSKMVPESPGDLPATTGTALDSFVTADWANWGTVLRIEVTAQSPAANCGNGNQCVYVDVEGKDSDHKLTLAAYRSTEKDNLFVTAVKVVKKGEGTAAGSVYMHDGGGVAQLEAEEEDEIEIRLAGSKIAPRKVDVENEAPEFGNFMPAHEAAYDDGDVDYTFTVTDAVSGIPEPEDLPDNDGNADYMPLVALVSGGQCHTVDPSDKMYTDYNFAGNVVWCMSKPEIRAVTDDRDFDEIDDGFEVETTIVLDANENHWVTFVVCDAAGNCELYTPDENKTDEALPLITIDTLDPIMVEARTGIMWDETDKELDKNNPTWIQVIFDDLSPLNDGTVEPDDFVVQGHTVKDAKRYEDDADDGRMRMIFLELEDQLAPDEEPEVTLVPNGVADIAGNNQDEGEVDAKDYIAPSFAVVSMVSPGTPEGSSNVLAGDGDEVVISITSDERIRKTQPDVTITYVNAPAGCVETSVDRSKLTKKADGSTYARGEIILAGDKEGCDSKSAMGGTLGKTFEKVSNTEWTLTVKEPASTGYYNIYIEADDRSAQNNTGSEGVAPGDIDTDFFERDGDLNSGDAHYFQGDINLPYPGVWVSGERIEETEPGVEFKTPLFVELDFTKKYISDCAKNISDDERNANCYAESDEYAKDSFDSVKVTSFTLDGTDITDSVKTTDNETFLVSIDNIGIGDHKIEVQALDEAGNDFDDTLTIEFEVEERDDFTKRLSPGWNLVSLPGEPADSSISVVFGSDIEVRTVYTYDPIMPGGWMVAVRESVDSDWQGDLKEITARRGYWVLSDAIQDWDVSIPRLAGGAVGSGTPIQPPVIALYAGWNLVPVIDVTGDFSGSGISAQAYLQSLDDGLDLARVLGFDTITNKWSTIKAPESGETGTLEYGKAYWVFVRQAASLVPGN